MYTNFLLDLVYSCLLMDYRVVSTKLTEDEHTIFLEFCNKKGLSPFAALKQALEQSMNEESSKEPSVDELRKVLALS